jgi:putative DNA primase/helicase
MRAAASAIQKERANRDRIAADFDALREQAETVDDEAEIRRLSKLSTLEYDRARSAAAERLGCRVSALDSEVRRLRGDDHGDTCGQGRAITFETVEPWPSEVNGADLLEEISGLATRHLSLPEHGADSVSLWVALTWLTDKVRILPLLAITSPEKGCGKTTVLEVLRRVCYRAKSTSNISPAALFRFVEMYQPTLLIDEGDSFLKDNEELRGILNSGHSRTSAFVIRTAGDDHEPREFSTWCPKAIAAIGKLPDTIHDRSILLGMRRRSIGETVAPIPDEDGLFLILRQKLARWTTDNGTRIAIDRPTLPDGVANRRADNWRILVAIADAAGGRWPDAARAACRAASTESGEDESLKVMLLTDLREIFAVDTKLGSERVTELLAAMPERPWPDCNHGKPISQKQLARWLKDFGIRSKNMRLPSSPRVVKGYEVEQFEDAWSRYLPGKEPLHRYKPDPARAAAASDPLHGGQFVADETPPEPAPPMGCSGVADEHTPAWEDL